MFTLIVLLILGVIIFGYSLGLFIGFYKIRLQTKSGRMAISLLIGTTVSVATLMLSAAILFPACIS